ncbi:MAG TPA: carboxypeptidase-like regulatory domain-containing protein [Sphingopyxis sp.]|nr:carboxypeptidase-like regulatory domain-containing protein [Sphingopyxis sp.]HMP44521.1 carboxypeptidase-like regulatory domain-containing protein [Sphingopyxis sp.]HMQ18937.1 carboxypeptidase-like regulatory domain-containing protein [Sphingopyxis sp.]
MIRAFPSWRRLIAAAMLALAGLMPGGAQAFEKTDVSDGWTPNEDDRWLLDLRSGQYRLGDGIRGYQTPRGLCIDLADLVMALDLPLRIDKKSRRATGWLFDERRTLTIDRDAGEVRSGSRSFALTPDAIRDTPAGWCADVAKLSAWLDLPLVPDLSNAVLRIETKEKLPFQLAAERRARGAGLRPQANFDLATLPQAARPYRGWATPSVDVAASVGAVSDKRGGSHVQARYEVFAAGEALKHSFDARLSSDNEGVPDSLRLRLYRSDPQGQLLGPLKATHYAAGDISLLSTGLVAGSAPGRGAVVTNRPVERPDSFDRTDFRGDLPAGWDAELYRNGQLLAFTAPNGDGRYEFLDVPLHYGTNRFEIVLYGPQGQIRREIRQLQVGMDSIPPRKTYYWAGFAQENTDLIGFGKRRRGAWRNGWRGTLGFERGLDARTSVAAYAHSLMIEDVRRNYGEVALRRAIGPTLVEVAGAQTDDGGTALRASWLAAFGETYVRAEAMRGWGGFVSDRFAGGIESLYQLSVDQSVRLGRTVLPLHFDLRHVGRTSGVASVEATARASASFRALTVTGQLDWSRSSAPFGPDPPDNLTATLLANARIGRVRLRGEARFALSGTNADSRATVIAEWAGKGDAEWRAEIGYDRGLDRARAGVGYTRRFNKLQLTGFGEAASDGSVAASLSVAFSFGPRPQGGGWRLSSEKLASRGQILAEVWMDENGDGIRQPGEAAMPGVALTAGHAFVEAATDRGGRGTIDGLEPFRPVMIGIDAGSLPDPYVQPALPGVVVTPRPGVATKVMLPMTAAGEIEGVVMRDGGNAIEGLALELVDAEGRVRATTLSEFDGYFLFESVAYGRYTVRLAKASAEALRLDAGFAMNAAPGKATPRVRLGTLVLKPVRRAMADGGEGATGEGNSARGPPGGL